MNTLAAGVAGAWNSDLAGLAPSNVHLVEVVTTDLTSPSAARGVWTGSHAGTRAGTAMTVNDCALLNFEISRRYRGGKPRTYNPWGVQGDLFSVQQWGSAFITAAENDWATFVTALEGFTFGSTTLAQQVNVSYYKGFLSVQNPVTLRWRNIPTLRTTPDVDNITTAVLSPFVGSQRRRVRA